MNGAHIEEQVRISPRQVIREPSSSTLVTHSISVLNIRFCAGSVPNSISKQSPYNPSPPSRHVIELRRALVHTVVAGNDHAFGFFSFEEHSALALSLPEVIEAWSEFPPLQVSRRT